MAKTFVTMHGPAFDDSGDLVNRQVPLSDVAAYRAAGYVDGSLPTEVFKSAATGEFVSDEFAAENPTTTYATTKKRTRKAK